jgi:DNA-binding XRE family transcriptional regulator
LQDASTDEADAPVRLRVAVYDAIARSKGFATVESQAAWHEVARSTMFRLRGGDDMPRLDTAMRMAADCGVPVEALFEFRRAA